MSLLAVGTIAFDSIETPFGKVDKIIGGSANYIAWSASQMCKNIHLCAVVGSDYPNTEIELLRDRGVNFDGLQVKENEKSFFWSGKYKMNFNDRTTLQTDLNVLKNFQPVIPENAKSAKYLMLGNLTPNVQLSVLDQMEQSPRLIAMDTMNYWIENDEYRNQLSEVLKKVDVIIINEEETRMLANHYSIIKGAKMILEEMGPKFVIVKKGEHGALLFHQNKVFFAPALPLEEVFDPTGAGDAFAGGFIGYLAQTDDISFENMKRAVIHGSMLASFCVEEFGPTRLKTITKKDFQNRLEEFIDLVQVDIEIQDY